MRPLHLGSSSTIGESSTIVPGRSRPPLRWPRPRTRPSSVRPPPAHRSRRSPRPAPPRSTGPPGTPVVGRCRRDRTGRAPRPVLADQRCDRRPPPGVALRRGPGRCPADRATPGQDVDVTSVDLDAGLLRFDSEGPLQPLGPVSFVGVGHRRTLRLPDSARPPTEPGGPGAGTSRSGAGRLGPVVGVDLDDLNNIRGSLRPGDADWWRRNACRAAPGVACTSSTSTRRKANRSSRIVLAEADAAGRRLQPSPVRCPGSGSAPRFRTPPVPPPQQDDDTGR